MRRATEEGVNLLCRWMSEVRYRTREMMPAPSAVVSHVPTLTCTFVERARDRSRRSWRTWQLAALSSGPLSKGNGIRAPARPTGLSAERSIGPGDASPAKEVLAARELRCWKRSGGCSAATHVAAWWTTRLPAGKHARQAEAKSQLAMAARTPHARQPTGARGSPAASSLAPQASSQGRRS